MTNLTKDQIREQRLKEEREFYLADDGSGYLDFIRDCGAAPDAEWEPHGIGAQFILKWEEYHDEETGQVLYKKKMVLWPRGSFKSQAFTIGLTCWLVAKYPDIRVFIGSETGKQARKFLGAVMNIIDSPWYVERFGKHRDDRRLWSRSSGFISAYRTKLHLKEPTVAAFGAGEVQTGAHWDFGMLDDPVSQENTKTPDAIETVNTWIGELLAQLDPGSKLLYIGTLHHYADFSAKMVKQGSDATDWQISRHEWIEDGKLFFPNRLTRAFVESQKRSMPLRQWYAYYHNKPMGEEEQVFKPTYLRVVRDLDVPSAVWTYILTDFAYTVHERNDRTVFWVVSLDAHRYAYVRDFYCGRWRPSDSIRLLCDIWDRCEQLGYNMRGVSIEKTGYDELLAGFLEEIRRETMTRPRIIPITGRSEEIKGMRIEGIEPRFREGLIYFVQSLRDQWTKWKPLFEEMTEWPFSEHDDIPDAISDLDKKDQRGKFLLPAPPHGFQPTRFAQQQPSLIDGKLNPKVPMDPRDLFKHLQNQGQSLWTPKTGQVNQDLLFRRALPPPGQS